MIIGITGTLAAGKGTIVEILKQKGFNHYSVRNYLMKEIEKRKLPLNRDSMVEVANELREKFGASFIVEELYKEAKTLGKNSIIESIRAIGEVEALKNKPDFYLISVDADKKKRYARAFERKSETDKIAYKEFIENEKREWENSDPRKQNLKQCIALSDFKINNNKGIKELEKETEKILLEIKKLKSQKRKDYIPWDEYFMGVAMLSAKRSKDPSTQVGACIVDKNKKIVGTGYNGTPIGISDDDFSWSRDGDYLDTKYPYVCHAELNAILNSTKESLAGCTIYVALFPCNECAKAIIQSGIKKVVYMSDKYYDVPSFIASRRVLEKAKIQLLKLNPKLKGIKLDFNLD